MEVLSESAQLYQILEQDLAAGLTHAVCVSNLAYHLAKEVQMDMEYCHDLAVAGILHDVGKMKLSSYLYGRAEDTLQVEEMKYVRMHSKLGYEILKKYEYSDFILETVLYHHENYDGSGYPYNLKGEAIPFGARILRVCDVFSALTSDRPYRKAFDMETAMELMIEEVKNFDMKIFLAFQRLIHYDNIEEIMSENYFKIEI